MKTLKKIKDKIKELSKNSRGQAILFFGGYFFFFLILFLIFKFGDRVPISKWDYEKGRPFNYSLENLTSDNYNFEYKIIVDGVSTIVKGEKFNDTELFEINNVKYYKTGNEYFINNKGIWTKCSNPYLDIVNFVIDIDNVSRVLDDAFYVSKTNYESGKEVYNFLISTNSLNYLEKNIVTDIDDKANEIVVSTDENLFTEEIKFKISSYGKYMRLCKDTFDIELYFDNYGEIEEIESPI